jgi:hypothetical protein
MNQDVNSQAVAPVPRTRTNYFHHWLVAFAPPAVTTLAGLTVFKDEIVRSIASSAHPVLVYVILAAFFTGLVFCAVALFRYQREARYIHHWHSQVMQGAGDEAAPSHSFSVSASIALSALGLKLPPAERQSRFELEVGAVRTALGEKLAYANYIGGALIGLGLVGTFVGLLGTLEDLGAVFGSLAQSGNSDMNPTAVFSNMVDKLQEPMKGMGTAFVSSLYGLLGSLLVGLCALSVSKAGASVIKDLLAAGRTHALLHPDTQEAPESVTAQTQDTHQLQATLERLLTSKIDTENQLQHWLEQSETRVAHMMAQTLQASWAAAAELMDEHQKVIDQMSTILGAHEDHSQILLTRVNEQDQQLTHAVQESVARNAADNAVLREEMLGALERTQTERSQQIDAIYRAIQNVSTQTERTTSDLFDHLQSQAKNISHLARSAAFKPSMRPLNGAASEEQPDGLSMLAQSIDRQTRLLEEVVRQTRDARSHTDESKSD